MKTILYLNNKYCLKLSDITSIVKNAVLNNKSGVMLELLTAFRDGIVESWLSDLSLIDKNAISYLNQIRKIRRESRDTDIIPVLSTIFSSSSYSFLINPLDYIELSDQFRINTGYKYIDYKFGDIIALPDNIKSFTLQISIRIKKSRNDYITVMLNNIRHDIPLNDKNKEHILICTVERDANSQFPDVVIKSQESVLRSVDIMNYVDLGLDVKWASCNLGARKLSEIGSFYSWGEISTKENYAISSFGGSRDIQNIAGNEKHDVATVILGENWRIPNKQQWQQLISKCTWTFESLNGVEGYRVTSKINSNSIFLPLTGYMDNKQHCHKDTCRYWSAIKDDYNDSYYLFCQKPNSNPLIAYMNKYYGLNIRPIYINK